MDEYFKEKYQEIYELHNDYSYALKLSEQMTTNFDTTSLNDARYALRAIVDCTHHMLAADRVSFDTAFGIAITALRIAWHDQVEIILDEFSIYVDELVTRYGIHIVGPNIDYKGCRDIIFKIEDAIRDSRQNRELRIQTYRDINTNDLQIVLNCHRACVIQEPVIAAIKLKEDEKLQREETQEAEKLSREKTRDKFARAGVAIAAIVGAVIIYANLFKNESPIAIPEISADPIIYSPISSSAVSDQIP